MSMKSTETLEAQREKLAQHLESLRATPAPTSTGKRGDPAKAWRAELASVERLIQDIDRLIALRALTSRPMKSDVVAESVQPERPNQAPRATSHSTVVDLARIPKGKAAEMRVSVKSWRGRRTVDIRLWYLPKGSSEWVPSRKGVSVDASKMPALLDALHSAGQHTPRE